MAARRYWRFQLFGPGAFGIYALAEARIRETPGGANITPAAVTASSSHAAGPISRLFDGVTSGATAWWATAAVSPPQWFQVDLGAGVARDIREFDLVARGDAAADGANQAPHGVLVSSSPDDVNYTDEWVAFCSVPWSAGGTQTFARSSIGTGTARYWGVMVVRTSNDGFVSVAEFALRNGAGPNLLIGATASANDVGGGAASQANDGVTGSGGWQSRSGAGYAWWLADLGAGNAIAVPQYLEITCAGGASATAEAPLDFSVVRGNTPHALELVTTAAAGAWSTNYQTQQFVLPAFGAAIRRRRRVFVVG